MRRLALISLAILVGCPQSITTSGTDASDAGDSGGPSTDTGADDAAMRDDSGVGSDAADLDAGPDDTGTATLTPLSFGIMTPPPATSWLNSVWATAANNIYVGSGNGNLWHFDGLDWTRIWHHPSNFGVSGIFGEGGEIYIAADDGISRVIGADQREHFSFSLGTVEDFQGRSATDMLLVANRQTQRAFYGFDGTQVSQLIELSQAAVYGVDAAPGGGAFISANGAIFRYDPPTLFPETIRFPANWTQNDIVNFDINDIATTGVGVFAVGDSHRILERQGNEWVFIHEPPESVPLQAIAGHAASEDAYVFGNSSSQGAIRRIYRGEVTSLNHGMGHNLTHAYATGPDEIFVIGRVLSTLDPVILRGSR